MAGHNMRKYAMVLVSILAAFGIANGIEFEGLGTDFGSSHFDGFEPISAPNFDPLPDVSFAGNNVHDTQFSLNRDSYSWIDQSQNNLETLLDRIERDFGDIGSDTGRSSISNSYAIPSSIYHPELVAML